MQTIYETREVILNLIRRYHSTISFLTKFLVGFFIYASISNIGHYNPAFALIGNLGFLLTTFMSILFAILPLNASYLIIILFTTVQFTAQLEIALIVFLGLISMFLFYGHFGKREGVLVLACVFGFNFNMPYLVPIIAGMYFGISSIIAIAIGVLIVSYGRMILSLITYEQVVAIGGIGAIDIEIDDILAAFMNLYESFTLGGDTMQTFVIITFAMFLPFISVYIISRFNINYNRELAILVGTFFNIFTFIFSSVFVDVGSNIFSIIFFGLLSGFIMYTINFFKISLDYTKAQQVEFQDDDYYYHVKIIPKKFRNMQSKKFNNTDELQSSIKNMRQRKGRDTNSKDNETPPEPRQRGSRGSL